MTMIALGLFKDLAIFFGDLLITSTVGEPQEFNTPTTNDINTYLDSVEHHVVAMKQKVHVISTRLVVCWAGSKSQARTMIRELAELDASEAVLTADRIETHIKSVPEGDRNDLSLIAAIANRSGDAEHTVAFFGYKADVYQLHSEEQSYLVVAGSGQEDFLKWIERYLERHPRPTTAPLEDHFHWAVGLGLSAAGWAMNREVWTIANAQKAWGGAFEVAALTHDGFQKISGDTLFLFLGAKPWRDGNELIIWPLPLFLKFDYVEDLFIVQKLEFEVVDSKLKFSEHSYVGYTPIFKEPSDYKHLNGAKLPDLSHQFLVTCVKKPDGSNYTLCNWTPREDSKVRIEFNGTDGAMVFKKDYLDILEREIQNATGLKTTVFIRADAE